MNSAWGSTPFSRSVRRLRSVSVCVLTRVERVRDHEGRSGEARGLHTRTYAGRREGGQARNRTCATANENARLAPCTQRFERAVCGAVNRQSSLELLLDSTG